jgi:hypothetical protein
MGIITELRRSHQMRELEREIITREFDKDGKIVKECIERIYIDTIFKPPYNPSITEPYIPPITWTYTTGTDTTPLDNIYTTSEDTTYNTIYDQDTSVHPYT